VLSSFAVVKLCKRFSVNPAFSLLIFYSIGTWMMYIAALKQCLAVFILMIALPSAIDKKYVRFYLLLGFAMLFHTHSFLFAIVPFLTGKPWGRMTWLLLGATVFAMMTYNVTLGAFMAYAQSIGALVDESEQFDGHSINILRVLVYWVPAILALLFRQRLFYNSTRTENLFVNMSIASAFILTIGTVQAANLFARMAGYFEIATIISLPWMLRKIFTPRSEKFITTSACALYFGYFCYENLIGRNLDADYSAISLWQFIRSLFA
jgi:transmembrane protein EpsG